MKKLLYISAVLLLISKSWSQITYPVNVETNFFTFKLGTNVVRNIKWPRADGMPLTGTNVDLVILAQVIAPTPTFTNTSHKLDVGIWVDNTNTQTATFTNPIVVLTPTESNIVVVALNRITQKNSLSNSLTTLRSWATQAAGTTVTTNNNVAVLQTITTRLGLFFDQFADLLEIQRINQ